MVAVLVALIGGVFAGQGLGYIPGSVMTGDIRWFWIGSVMFVAAVVFIAGAVWFRPAKKQT